MFPNTSTKSQTFDSIDRLSQRVLSGEAVFFVGAGFSIDSEGNTAVRLIRRLVIQLAGILYVLESEKGGNLDASHVREDFINTFDAFRNWMEKLPQGDEIPLPDPETANRELGLLAEKYYEVNDWCCAAFERLLVLCNETSGPSNGNTNLLKERLEAIHNVTETLRQQWKETGIDNKDRRWTEGPPIDDAKFDRVSVQLCQLAVEMKNHPHQVAGKILFLDTMGFNAREDIMGGKAKDPDMDEVKRSYHDRLKPRHWVLARFAREGWASLLVTTNFDRLLEGGFRLSGFRTRKPGNKTDKEDALPVNIPYWSRVSSPIEFFTYGNAHQSSLLVKIHGCAEGYAENRNKLFEEDEKPRRSGSRYLRSMVFTFREIQNWREDSWSRDFLSTLLRTRTMVFCAYSAQDPVIHDTLRSVYEEMGRERHKLHDMETGGDDASAYYFASDDSGKKQFYGSEVLRAATLGATGQPATPHEDHPNYLRYKILKDGNFPNLDDFFIIINHLAVREYQRRCLASDLSGIAQVLLGEPIRDHQFSALLKKFNALIEKEKNRLAHLFEASDEKSDSARRHEMNQLCNWSYFFHPNLLRELSSMEAFRRKSSKQGRQQGGGLWHQEMKALNKYYYPMSAQPGLTAWSVVVEIALRNMAGMLRDKTVDATNPDLVGTGMGRTATFLFREHPRTVWRSLTFIAPVHQYGGRIPRPDGVFKSCTYWELSADKGMGWLPFSSNQASKIDNLSARIKKVPPADYLWRWAATNIQTDKKKTIAPWLGLEEV